MVGWLTCCLGRVHSDLADATPLTQPADKLSSWRRVGSAPVFQDCSPEVIRQQDLKTLDWKWQQRRTALTFLVICFSAFLGLKILFSIVVVIFLSHMFSKPKVATGDNAMHGNMMDRVDATKQRFPFDVDGREPLRRLGDDGDPRDCWSEPPGSLFFLRGKSYMDDRIKMQASGPFCTLVRVSFFAHSTRKITHMARIPFIKRFLDSYPNQQFIIYVRHLAVDGQNVHGFGIYARTCAPGVCPQVDKLWDRFFAKGKSPEETTEIQDFRRKRFKYICNVSKAPAGIGCFMDSIGGTRPVILGNTIGADFFEGPNYVEVAMDAGNNHLGKVITNSVASYFESMVIDEMVLLEGQKEDELPEQPLFSLRFNFCDLRRVMRAFPEGALDTLE